MSPSFSLPVILSGLVAQLPLVVISLLGLIVSLARWRDAPAASRWTLASSLLSLFVCVAAPVSHGLLMEYTRLNGASAAGMGFYYSGLGFAWATLRAVSIGFLLIAVYAGRRTPVADFGATLPPPPGYPVQPNR